MKETLPFNEAKSAWESFRLSLPEEVKNSLLWKGAFALRLRLLLEGETRKRETLLKEGDFQRGYAFKMWSNDPERNNRLWILHSPEAKLSEDNSLYPKITANLQSIEGMKDRKQLLKTIQLPLSDAYYLELPQDISEGHLVYLSIVDLPNSYYTNPELGFVYLLGRKSISKRILVLSPFCLKTLEAYRLKEIGKLKDNSRKEN